MYKGPHETDYESTSLANISPLRWFRCAVVLAARLQEAVLCCPEICSF